MISPSQLWGRLGNQMFLLANHYARTQETGTHFFVQDEKYFEKYKDDIKKMFSLGINPNSIPKVAIHRRLGDYKGNSFYVDLGHHDHENLDDNYYMKAIAEFPNAYFTVFSDDIEQAKTEPMFQGSRFNFSEGRSDVEDLNLMASHQGIIGANSSFSWWGAWLSGAEKIIFPKAWFSNPADDQYIGVPSTWQRL